MPELPEVESIRIGLERKIKDLRIVNIEILNKGSFIGDRKKVFAKLVKLDRRGKCLIVGLSNGNSLAIHLKMTGKLVYLDRLEDFPDHKHTRVIFEFEKGYLIFNDIRKFGWIRVDSLENIESLLFLTRLGPEPFRDLDFEYFQKALSRSNARIISFLLDQTKIAGVGNIYANDALFLAGIYPLTSAALVGKRALKLFDSLHHVLRLGLREGGASARDYVNIEGKKGNYQDFFLVYGREGMKCRKCTSLIERGKLGGRSYFYCPKCQA